MRAEVFVWYFLRRKLAWRHAKTVCSLRYDGDEYWTIWSTNVVIGLEIDHAQNSNSYSNIHQRGDGEELRGYVQ
jgi:hypothetical protein